MYVCLIYIFSLLKDPLLTCIDKYSKITCGAEKYSKILHLITII